MKEKYISEIAWSKIFAFLKNCKGVYVGSAKKYKKFFEASFKNKKPDKMLVVHIPYIL